MLGAAVDVCGGGESVGEVGEGIRGVVDEAVAARAALCELRRVEAATRERVSQVAQQVPCGYCASSKGVKEVLDGLPKEALRCIEQ